MRRQPFEALYAAAVFEMLLFVGPLGNFAVRRYVAGNPDIPADHGSLSDDNPAENRCPRIDDHIVFNDRMAGDTFYRIAVIVEGEAVSAEGYSLIDSYSLANDAGFTDYDTRSVIDKEIFSNRRSRMYVYPRYAVGVLRDDSRDNRDLQLVQLVSQSVVGYRQYAWITKDRLVRAPGRGITIVCSAYILGQQGLNFRQTV